MKTYWFKEIASNPVIVNGAPVQFQHVPGNRGLLELDAAQDDLLVVKLTEMAKNQIGGVVKLSEKEYAEKKSSVIATPSARPREMLRVVNPSPNPFPQGSSPSTAATVAPPANPAEAPAGSAPAAPAAPAADPAAPAATFRPAVRRVTRSAAKELAVTEAPAAAAPAATA